MNRKKLVDAFNNYTKAYNPEETKIKLKYEHTFFVAQISDLITENLQLSKEDRDLAWAIGMLHDIGRFEQVKRFGTYKDSISVDHAAFGADLLFKDNLIEKFLDKSDCTDETQYEEYLHLIEISIRNHNIHHLPEELGERERLFSQIIRDADKVDIMRANVEFPLEEICNVTSEELYSAGVCDETMEAFLKHETILRSKNMGVADGIMNQIAFIFALYYPISLSLMVERGHIFKLVQFHSQNPEAEEKFDRARAEVKRYLTEAGYDVKDKI